MKEVRIGCSGWSYDDWKGRLYPKGLPTTKWLPHYAEEFSTVEVNNTFYRLPIESAVENWVEQTPDDFLFTLKISRYLTHVKRLTEVRQGMRRYMSRVKALTSSDKAGPFLWQFPETFRREDDRLERALEHLPAGRHAFEFRHESWFKPEVYELLREHGVALVIGDSPKWPFQARELTADWTLIRLHRGSGKTGRYSERELDRWKRRIAAWRRTARPALLAAKLHHRLLIARLVSLPAAAEHAREPARLQVGPEPSMPLVRGRQLRGLLGGNGQDDSPLRGALHLRGVGEPELPVRGLDHDTVEDVLCVVVEHHLHNADLDLIGAVHRGSRLDRRVVDRMTVVDHCQEI
jgi:uncharacterized protein YecE (DUF72 family)